MCGLLCGSSRVDSLNPFLNFFPFRVALSTPREGGGGKTSAPSVRLVSQMAISSN